MDETAKPGPDWIRKWNGIGRPQSPLRMGTGNVKPPGFLRRDLTETPESTEKAATRGHATQGCVIGGLAAFFFWVVPIPVATIVWVFDLKGAFGDYMLLAMPFLLMLPIVGAIIAGEWGRRHGTNSFQRQTIVNPQKRSCDADGTRDRRSVTRRGRSEPCEGSAFGSRSGI